MPKYIGGKAKRGVIKALAVGELKKKDIAKHYKISYSSLTNILNQNAELYQNTVEQLKKHITAGALIKAEKAISKINNKKLRDSSALSLSQTAKNLVDITKNDQSNVNIVVNLPESRDELVRIITSATNDIKEIVVDNPDIGNKDGNNENKKD